ncbi:acyl-CoA thioesterase [Gammaproteobacteria bacterium]|nr:acyl-CoA thioesterase [Gammaproteobacteria bacterium]
MNTEIFSYPILIKENHLDMFGHVNNATYLELLEEARWDIITKNGYGLSIIQKTGIGPIILEINIKFLNEIKLRENIIINTKLISYEGKKIILEQQILRNEELCSIAEFTIALFDIKHRKLVSPTPEWLKSIGA